jgi:beta-glucosidase
MGLCATRPAQSGDGPGYLDPNLDATQRAADLVSRLTLQEKVSQLVNQSRAIPRLKIPAYDWWSEALHGVAANGVTEYPEPVGLAASFDTIAVRDMATAIGVEARLKHGIAERAGHSYMFEGLDFWAPNVNIFRDPRWGRGQETYGEDPYLSARMGVAYVEGLQGDDSRYLRAIATPKHFAVHSGPEPTRHFADVDVSRHDLEDTYLPAFRAAVIEGKAASVMCAYNAVNGEPACASTFLLEDTLRGAWHFQGYVVSDCEAVRNIFLGHHYRASQSQASAIALTRGMDNECIDFGLRQDDQDYRPYLEAVQEGYLSEQAIDTALVRLFKARVRLGMFDPPAQVPYAKLDPMELEGSRHRALAERLASESMVLLKNDGVLPLHGVKHILVVGPLAEQTNVLLGNYNGMPSHTVSILEGMRAEFPNAQINFSRGTQYLSNRAELVPAAQLQSTDGKPGLSARYAAVLAAAKNIPAVTRIESVIDLSEASLPSTIRGGGRISVSWHGVLQPKETGTYLIGLRAQGAAKLIMDGHKIVEMYGPNTDLAPVHLDTHQPVALQVEYATDDGRPAEVQLLWTRENNNPDPAAVDAAAQADVIVAVVGLTSRLEGEEMPVNRPGFFGGDRTGLDLPAPEETLLQTLAATGKPMIVVLLNGSALSVVWAKDHANAILEAWYPGQAGGSAVAKTLSGSNNPAGRLPVTFYRDTRDLPPFEDYSMAGRTYRYFAGEPLWPFGFGLSFTSFEYRDLRLATDQLEPGAGLDVQVTLRNTGRLAGDEVAQLYLKFPNVPGAPLRALRGFQRVHLAPNESRRLRFHLDPRDLSMVTEVGDIIVAQGAYTVSVGGGQPDGSAPTLSQHFQIHGQVVLPE